MVNCTDSAGAELCPASRWAVNLNSSFRCIFNPLYFKILYYFFKIISHFKKLVQNFKLKKVGGASKSHQFAHLIILEQVQKDFMKMYFDWIQIGERFRVFFSFLQNVFDRLVCKDLQR